MRDTQNEEGKQPRTTSPQNICTRIKEGGEDGPRSRGTARTGPAWSPRCQPHPHPRRPCRRTQSPRQCQHPCLAWGSRGQEGGSENTQELSVAYSCDGSTKQQPAETQHTDTAGEELFEIRPRTALGGGEGRGGDHAKLLFNKVLRVRVELLACGGRNGRAETRNET